MAKTFFSKMMDSLTSPKAAAKEKKAVKTPAKAPAKKAAVKKVVAKKAVTKVVKKPVAKPVAKVVAKPKAKPAPKPKAVVKPKVVVKKPLVKPVVKPVAKPVAKVVAKPAAKGGVKAKVAAVKAPAIQASPRVMPMPKEPTVADYSPKVTLAPPSKLVIDSLIPLTDKPTKERGYPDNYVPTDREPYMSVQQMAYFRDLLLVWRRDLEAGNLSTMHDLKENSTIEADMTDQATLEYEQTLELRNRDRARKLINKIDEALDRIRDGEFGFCQETGDPIGIGRLLARPIATLSIEAKRRQEKKEVSYAG